MYCTCPLRIFWIFKFDTDQANLTVYLLAFSLCVAGRRLDYIG